MRKDSIFASTNSLAGTAACTLLAVARRLGHRSAQAALPATALGPGRRRGAVPAASRAARSASWLTAMGALMLVATVLLGACTPSLGQASSGATASPTEGQSAATARPSTPAAQATATSKPAKPGYLYAKGSKLVDADGNEVILTGINWFGLETGTYAPHGLWSRNWNDMLDQIDALGYNVIRLPYSNQILDPNSRPIEGIDFDLNPDLRGLNGLQIMDKIVEGAGKRGIKVILDRHRPSPNGQSKLWYTEEVPESTWIADWRFLAQRYKDNDTVIGADLHNEPAGDATWGTDDPKTDWRLAAERAGNAILEVNPNWLIIVEGVEKQPNDWYWMGGNLAGVAKAPVRLSRPDKLVYSAHDYGPGVFEQGWFHAKEFPANLPAIWDAHWGYIVKQNIAPVLLGEFGGRSVGEDTEGIWQRALLDYLKEHGISYTYWSLNPNSGDTGGVLEDDWTTINEAKQKVLAAYQKPKVPIANPSFVDTSGAPIVRQKPLPDQQVKVQFKPGKADPKTDELALEIQVVNQTESRVPLENVELSYWLAAPDLDAAREKLTIDWSSVDPKLIRTEIVPEARADQTHRIAISFAKDAGMIPANGAAEIKLRLKRSDRGVFDQTRAFSFEPVSSYSDADHIALYFWGVRVWGVEP